VDWYDSVFEFIDMRSFSNLWYWIGLAVLWSTASHWILGVPFDLVQRASRDGGEAERDLQDLVRINTNRIGYVISASGHWLVALVCALLTGLLITGFWYKFEFAQAVFFLAFPMSLVGALNVWTSRRIVARAAEGAALRKLLGRHRLITQLLGVVSIFITGMYGMSQNVLVVEW
jgi:hypothetical protein